MSARDVGDLDFTQVLKPVVARPRAEAAPRANGNFIAFAKGRAGRRAPTVADAPVLVVEDDESKDLAHALSLGADGYLTKPLTPSLLHSMIDKVLVAQP